MTPAELREPYLRWVRRAVLALALPLALTALMQAAFAAEWWGSGPAPSGAARYLFLSVAVASVVVGRNVRTREIARGGLSTAALTSLSWRLLTYALAPVAIGAPLALMTRQPLDYYALLGITLLGTALLFPRFDQWVAWAGPAAGTSSTAAGTTTAEGGDRP